ncbi:MAG TPA: hypothetical protein DEP35_22825 [Deltaproteobacteria bacterium]|nr:hypothetical protein [Deltaproteobacteria bacterium]
MIECGASVPGEIPRQRDIVRPDVAVVTTVDAGHLEGFGSIEKVLEEKASLLNGAPTAVVGTHPPKLAEVARRKAKKVVTAGLAGADWTAEKVELLPDGRPRFTVRGVEIELPLPGRHMVANALVALAVADVVGVPLASAGPALAGASLPAGRSEIVELDGNTVINDTYNANPQSMEVALRSLAELKGSSRAIAVLGDMGELGATSLPAHRATGQLVAELGIEYLFALGQYAKEIAAGALAAGMDATRVRVATDHRDASDRLREILQGDDWILVKGSRSMQMERVVDALVQAQREAS